MKPLTALSTLHPWHRAWSVLLGCCLLFGGVVGFLGNSAGIYMVAVTDEHGWTLASFNVYLTLLALVMAATMPFAGRLLQKYPLRPQLLAALIAACGTYALSGTFTTLWQWYVAGVVLGVSYGFLMYIPIPMVISNWFVAKNGLAIGLSAAFASLVAAVANPVGSNLIESIGWRPTRVIFALCAFAMAGPATLVLIRKTPAEVGCVPYGDARKAPGSSTVAPVVASRTHFSVTNPVFWAVFVIGGLFALAATMLQQAPSHAARIGIDAHVDALGVSAVMIGGIIFKLLLGVINDATNTIIAGLTSAGLGASGALIVLSAGDSALAFLIGCAVFGGGYAGLTVIPPLTVRYFFGTANYAKIYSYVTFALGLFSAIGPVFYSFLSDTTGAFTIAWACCAGFYVIIAGLIVASQRATTKKTILNNDPVAPTRTPQRPL